MVGEVRQGVGSPGRGTEIAAILTGALHFFGLQPSPYGLRIILYILVFGPVYEHLTTTYYTNTIRFSVVQGVQVK